MPNDFQPRLGHQFQFRTDPAPGFDGIVNCQVRTIDAPRTLAFSWRGGPIDTVVRFDLQEVPGGTKLIVRHEGFQGLHAVLVSLILGAGWKRIRHKLAAVLAELAEGPSEPHTSETGSKEGAPSCRSSA